MQEKDMVLLLPLDSVESIEDFWDFSHLTTVRFDSLIAGTLRVAKG
jgi:hypothetical protein